MSRLSERMIIVAYKILGFILTLTGMSLSYRKCRKLLQNARPEGYDMVIIPGVPYKTSGWDVIMKGRLIWAKYLYDNGIARNVIFSGAAVYTPYNEGEIMALYAVALGIPRENVFVERKAEHGTENIYYSYHKSKKKGFKTFALATDPFQSRMLQKFMYEKIDKNIGMLPIVFSIVGKIEPVTEEPMIEAGSALKQNWVSIKERMGFFRRLQGTRGLDIDPQAY